MKELSKAVNTNKTMSSKQLSAILGYASKEINKKIRSMFGEEKARELFSPALDNQNRVVDYHLPEKESKMFVAKYDIDYLEKVIEFWICKSQPAIPKNFAEALQLAADQAKQIEVKNDLIIASNEASIKAGEISVREFVKTNDAINIGGNKFLDWLREEKFIFQGSRQPLQQYVDNGWFTWKFSEVEINGKKRRELKITPRGQLQLAKRYMKLRAFKLEQLEEALGN